MQYAADQRPRSDPDEPTDPTLTFKLSTKEIFMTRKRFIPTAAATLLAMSALFGTSALASGSDAGGGAETGNSQSYNVGKAVYAQKLACKSCPLAGKKLDAAMANQLLKTIDTYSLSANEQQALATYLKLRFKL